MKIIGEAPFGKMLIEASKNEIANLFGAFSQHSLKDVGMKESDIKPGLEINVEGSYQRLYWLNQKQSQFTKLRAACEDVLKRTAEVKPVFSVIKGD